MRALSDRGHIAPEGPPLQLAVGEQARVGERSTEWPEFVFVSTNHGTGWVPARYLSGDRGMVVVEQEYNTKELDVAPGREVTVLERDDVSGWWWCRGEDSDEGWVPVAALIPLDS